MNEEDVLSTYCVSSVLAQFLLPSQLIALSKASNALGEAYAQYIKRETINGCEYVNGILHGKIKKWNGNGQLALEDDYVDGKKHGKSKAWRPNGQLWWKNDYVNGKLHGKTKEWHKNGQLAWEFVYVDEKLHGKSMGWHENGQLKQKNDYVDGIVQKDKK